MHILSFRFRIYKDDVLSLKRQYDIMCIMRDSLWTELCQAKEKFSERVETLKREIGKLTLPIEEIISSDGMLFEQYAKKCL